MSEDEKVPHGGFLSRWSQRKQEAKLPDADGAAVQADRDAKPPPAVAEVEAEEAFDLSSLPKLEDISGSTDITGFLRKGVPENVKNAVLRKSWALDPAIRNYVNPALDYAYDWNTPGGVPGTSELAAGTDIAKMVLQIMGGGSTDPEAEPNAQDALLLDQIDAPATAEAIPEIAAVQNNALEIGPEPVRLSLSEGGQMVLPEDSAPSRTGQHGEALKALPVDPSALQHAVRRHGSAKPKV